MYEELIQRLREESEIERWLQPHSANETPKLLDDAADAIEDLTNKIMQAENDSGLYDSLPIVDQRECWIPVTERLPEHLTSVIVHRKDGGIFLWEYFNTSPTDECWMDDSMNVYSFFDVTHWMPLPEPPEEET